MVVALHGVRTRLKILATLPVGCNQNACGGRRLIDTDMRRLATLADDSLAWELPHTNIYKMLNRIITKVKCIPYAVESQCADLK
jgi:hypothetical protein